MQIKSSARYQCRLRDHTLEINQTDDIFIQVFKEV